MQQCEGRHSWGIGGAGSLCRPWGHCAGGGVCVTSDNELARKMRLATDKAYDRSPGARREPTFLANNYRMTELQGAVALAQLGKLESIISRRRSWCMRLSQRLSDLEG